jgi:hypothetical protein
VLAWPAESGTNTDAVPTGARMGLGIATVTTCDEDVPKGTRHPRHLAISVANEGCSVHSTGPAAGWKPVETLYCKNKRTHHQKAAPPETAK